MAKYRPVYTKIWKDSDFQNYCIEGKLLFLYLFTNDLLTESGIYQITLNTISNETGIPLQTVYKLLENGSTKNVYYDFENSYVFVKNSRKYGSGGNPSLLKKSIEKDFKYSHKTGLWDLFKNEYQEFDDIITNPNRNPNPNPNPNQTLENGLETVSKGNKKHKDKDNNIFFDFKSKKFINLKNENIKKWKKAFPEVDIDIEILRASEWLIANPERKRENYKRFLFNWFVTAANRFKKREKKQKKKKVTKEQFKNFTQYIWAKGKLDDKDWTQKQFDEWVINTLKEINDA